MDGKKMKSLLPILLILLSAAVIFADEPGWTPEQRIEHRDAVVTAVVISVKKIKNETTDIDLYSAVLKIDKTIKAHPELKESTVTVFFLMSPKGAGYRCPNFADPKEKMIGTFYLRYHDYLTGKKAFLIEMGSDITEDNKPNHAVHPTSRRPAAAGPPAFSAWLGVKAAPRAAVSHLGRSGKELETLR
ncbi:MAG: hypothetical protein HC904_16415 [Blastochloris sp.]|nr:hypothetical protein [Blastochloris sp.]